MIETDILFVTYNGGGGHPVLSWIGDFLLLESHNRLGKAISKIELYPRVLSRGHPEKTLGSLFERFQDGLNELPRIWFKRKKGLVEIAYQCQIIDADEILGESKPKTVTYSQFGAACHEVVAVLKLLGKRLKPTDDFDFSAFERHLEKRLIHLPSTNKELARVIAELKNAERRRRASDSPWDLLGIAWEDFHPKAREILDDPYFWDCTDDFSPNGNDVGAEILEAYRKWQSGSKKSAITLFRKQIQGWGAKPLDPAEDPSQSTYDEAIIGLAFAELKFTTECSQAVRDEALAAIDRQLQIARSRDRKWKPRELRIESLERMKKKLIATRALT
jgi:uncharacterized protein YfeS